MKSSKEKNEMKEQKKKQKACTHKITEKYHNLLLHITRSSTQPNNYHLQVTHEKNER